MKATPEHHQRMRTMTFASVFPHYVVKIEQKGRTVDELYEVIEWLTGYNQANLHEIIEQNITFEDFFNKAKLHPNASLI